MANTNAPFGFRHVGSSQNATPNFALTRRRIASGNSGAIYQGDPVQWVTGTATGFITAATSTTATSPLAGIFYGCEYISTSQKRKVWSNYWPGSDTAHDVIAYVIDDPNAKFIAQAGASGFTITNRSDWGTNVVGQLATFTMGTGSSATGLSGAYVSGTGTTNTYGFVVLDIVTDLGAPDPTSGYNWVVVGFNNEALRGNTAVTGIS